MNDGVRSRDGIESPCVKVCVIDPQARLCVGCLRSLEEIGAWSALAPAARRAIMAELPGRAPMVAPLRLGGRRGEDPS